MQIESQKEKSQNDNVKSPLIPVNIGSFKRVYLGQNYFQCSFKLLHSYAVEYSTSVKHSFKPVTVNFQNLNIFQGMKT